VTYQKTVKRPVMVEQVYMYFSSIDIHNHYRQGTLALEESWGTHTWWHRLLATVLGIVVTDAYFMYCMDYGALDGVTSPRQSFLDFCNILADELIHNLYGETDE
jgi:hypothetical protein